MTIKNKFKNVVCHIVFFVLGRGLKTAYKLDKDAKEELDNNTEGFCVTMQAANGAFLTFAKTEGKIVTSTTRAISTNPDIHITFKSLNSALLVLLGRIGIARAFTEHRMTVKGDIYTAMGVVRVMDIVENYLFPPFISNKILIRKPQKNVNTLRFYAKAFLNI